jgi:hypothetical protein
VPVIKFFVTSFVGAGPLGTVTVGSLDSGEGGFGVPMLELDAVEEDEVVLAAAVIPCEVGPLDGASCTPGAVEPPQALTPAASVSIPAVRRLFFTMRPETVAVEPKKLRSDSLEHGSVNVEVGVDCAHVVQLLERLDQLQQLSGIALL